jgi:hypothetical protein
MGTNRGSRGPRPGRIVKRRHDLIALLAICGVSFHLVLRFALGVSDIRQQWPSGAVLIIGAVLLTVDLVPSDIIQLENG